MLFRRYREPFAVDNAAVFKDLASAGCFHACAEAVLTDTFDFFRLEYSFWHEVIISGVYYGDKNQEIETPRY